jgi:hypothetical protein
LLVQVNYSAATAFSTSKLQEMQTDGEDKFILTIENKNSFSNNNSNNLYSSSFLSHSGSGESEGGVRGIGITLMISQANDIFCGISQVKIFAVPNS